MRALTLRTQLGIGVVLIVLMGVTRGDHFAPMERLPSASWAIFFLAGVYLSSRWVFPALLAEAAALDVFAIQWGGVSDFCVSPAYGFLLPAYGTLWFAGHWYAERHHDTVATFVPLTISVLVGAAACEVVSSGSFYFFSGRFEPTSMVQFARRFTEYFPRSFASLAFYVCLASMIHAAVRMRIMSLSGDRASG